MNQGANKLAPKSKDAKTCVLRLVTKYYQKSPIGATVAGKQHVKTVVVNIPDTFTEQQIRDLFPDWKNEHHSERKIILIHKGKISETVI